MMPQGRVEILCPYLGCFFVASTEHKFTPQVLMSGHLQRVHQWGSTIGANPTGRFVNKKKKTTPFYVNQNLSISLPFPKKMDVDALTPTELKQKGNVAHFENCNVRTIEYYSQAINILEGRCTDDAERVAQLHLCYANRSLQLRITSAYALAIHDAARAIAIRPDFWRAYLRRAPSLATVAHPGAAPAEPPLAASIHLHPSHTGEKDEDGGRCDGGKKKERY